MASHVHDEDVGDIETVRNTLVSACTAAVTL